MAEKPTEHQGLPVAGYRPQDQLAVDLVNEHKIIEEHLLRRLDDLVTLANTQAGVGEKQVIDRRWLAVAKTHFEEGFMALNRSIFQPDRINDLPSEFNFDHLTRK